jgi:hypothetical protein
MQNIECAHSYLLKQRVVKKAQQRPMGNLWSSSGFDEAGLQSSR